jgi:predicted DsbA family dithiol-disulfide isomerase
VAVKVEYYSDVLCVWAWIAQRRLDELRQHFGSELELKIHYVNVFGNTSLQIGEKWASKGGFDGFGQHVVEAAAPFSNAPVVDSIWQTVRPQSSTPAHTVLKAVEISHSTEAAENFAYIIRKRFFTGPLDIGQLEVLLDLADNEGLDVGLINATLNSGTAIADVMRDYQRAHSQGIKGSPSWVLDSGRQILYGNVGYRVLRANAAELLNQPPEEASWC